MKTAPAPWALTGGTALQSYLPEEERRYSTDLDIMTTADETTATRWLDELGLKPKKIMDNALRGILTPEGTLYVIFGYLEADFRAADVETQEFQHFSVRGPKPPEVVRAPLVSFPFLVATKLFGIQSEDRGGDRRKDAYDLALTLPRADMSEVSTKLVKYAAHRGRPREETEITRSAAVFLDYYAGAGYESFTNWLRGFLRPDQPMLPKDALIRAHKILADQMGHPPRPQEAELLRFALNEMPANVMGAFATKFGFKGDMIRESEKMRDFVVAVAVKRLGRPLPTTVDALTEALNKLS